MNRRALLCRSALLLAAGPALAQPAQAPTFVMTTDAEENSYYGIWLRRIYAEALKRLGWQLDTVASSTKRAGLLASQGHVDGEMVRAPGYAAAHPELIMLDAPIYPVVFAIYARAAAPEISNLEDLRDAPGHVVFRRGVLFCEKALKGLVPPARLTEVATPESALGMLAREHARYYCEVDSSVTNVLTRATVAQGLTAYKLFDLGPPVHLRGFVHQRHAELAPRLSAVLRRMEAEGLYEAYRQEALRQLRLQQPATAQQ